MSDERYEELGNKLRRLLADVLYARPVDPELRKQCEHAISAWDALLWEGKEATEVPQPLDEELDKSRAWYGVPPVATE